jgi:hypothetical protein
MNLKNKAEVFLDFRFILLLTANNQNKQLSEALKLEYNPKYNLL